MIWTSHERYHILQCWCIGFAPSEISTFFCSYYIGDPVQMHSWQISGLVMVSCWVLSRVSCRVLCWVLSRVSRFRVSSTSWSVVSVAGRYRWSQANWGISSGFLRKCLKTGQSNPGPTVGAMMVSLVCYWLLCHASVRYRVCSRISPVSRLKPESSKFRYKFLSSLQFRKILPHVFRVTSVESNIF